MSRNRLSKLRTVGLFAGIGGFEVGLSKAGHEIVSFCENDAGARAVLMKHFDGVRVHEDICHMPTLPQGVDLVVAGFPCQDLSPLGTTRGVRGPKSNVVAHVFRMLKVRRVPWVLLENVPFMLRLHRGAAMKYITRELEELGYKWAYRTIDSRAFGLPQRRERVFLLAALEEDPSGRLFESHTSAPQKTYGEVPPCGFYWTEGNRGIGWAPNAIPTLKGGSALGIPSPPAIWLRDGSIVTLDIRDAERVQGFTPNWTKPAELVTRRNWRWRLVGNAVTTRVAEWLGHSLANGSSETPEGLIPLKSRDPWPNAAMGGSGVRFRVDSNTWPVARKGQPIDDFLRYDPRPLSYKATKGFWDRLQNSTLAYPPEFGCALKAHIARVRE